MGPLELRVPWHLELRRFSILEIALLFLRRRSLVLERHGTLSELASRLLFSPQGEFL